MAPAGTDAPSRRNDLELYERHADEWWDDDSRAFRSLRAVKSHHLAVLDGRLGAALAGARVADLGCGGGLLAVPLAQRGAVVTGVDRSAGSIAAAQAAAARLGVAADFVVSDLTATPLPTAAFDLVVLGDVLEHLQPFGPALVEAARLLRDGGQLYVNTLNRTWQARWLAVHLAEGLGYVPRGTHDPRLFIRPAELRAVAERLGLRWVQLCGERPRLLATLRSGAIRMRPARGTRVSYGAFLERLPRLAGEGAQDGR